MPVQAKSDLAALLAADDLPTSSVQPNSKDDSDKTDFGAALGGLVAAMLAPAPFAPPATQKNSAEPAIDETSTVANDTTSHRATATPVPALTSNEISSPVLAALFDSAFANSAVSAAAGSKNTNGSTAKTSSDPIAQPKFNSTDQSSTPVSASDCGSVSGLPQAKSTAEKLVDANPKSTEAVSAGSLYSPAATVSIKIEKTPTATTQDRETPESQAASHDQHTYVSPATLASSFEHASLLPTSGASQQSASPLMPGDNARRESSNAATAEGAETSASNAPAKDPTQALAPPMPTEGLGAPVSPPIEIAARAASAYRDASAAVAPARDHPTIRRNDQFVDTVGSPQASTSSDTPSPKVTEAAQIRQILDSFSNAPSARVANVKVDLADGQSAQAMVRERAGNVDVKIVAPGADSARHITGEVDSLRSALEGAGLHLGHSEVSYQSHSGERGREHRETAHDSNQQTKQSNEVFTLSEVNE